MMQLEIDPIDRTNTISGGGGNPMETNQTVLIVGLGYVGLPIAVRAAEAGHTVIGVDVSRDKVDAVNNGHSYVEDVPSDRLAAVLANGRFTARVADHIPVHFDIALITVPTPVDHLKKPDLTYIVNAAAYLAKHLRGGETVVLESTTYPGTTDTVVADTIRETSGHIAGRDYRLGYSPERINPGDNVNTFQATPKIVSGIDAESLETIEGFYRTLVDTVVPVSNPRTAELAKIFENTFANVNIALVNEMALICRELGIDVDEMLDAAVTKGHNIMRYQPGIGVGGHSVLPGTLILTEHGMRPIETIQEGDRVVAADGKLHPVLKAWSHPYDGDVVTIRGRGMLPITLTEEHRVPVAADGRPARKGRKHHPVTGKSTAELLGEVQEKHVRDIVPGTDFVFWPLVSGDDHVRIPSHATEEYIRLAGWYLSEGTMSGKTYADGSWVPMRVGFGLHVEEVDYQAEIVELVETVGSKYPRAMNASGARVELDHEHNRGNVFYGSRPLAEQLINDFGQLQHERSVPGWLLFGPEEWVPLLLRGMLCGDGMLRRSEMTFATTSEGLAYSAMILLNRLGAHATIRTQQSRDRRQAWYVQVRGTETLERLYALIGATDIIGDERPENIQYPIRDGKVFRTVESVEFSEYTGLVYDLTVDEDHTFLTSGALVHNCISVDPLYLAWLRRDQYGKSFKFAELADEVNSFMPRHTADRARDILADRRVPLWESRIMVLGSAYKPGVADTRESPAIDLIEHLRAGGATVDVLDPHVNSIDDVELASKTAGDYDLVIVATAHPEFDYGTVQDRANVILDGRNVYPTNTPKVHKL